MSQDMIMESGRNTDNDRQGSQDNGRYDIQTETNILFGVNDKPPWYQCACLGFQHYLTMFGSALTVPLVIIPLLCVDADSLDRGYIIGTIFFVSGLLTLIQATFGVRLPIVQGGSFAFLPPAIALLQQPKWRCPTDVSSGNASSLFNNSSTTSASGDGVDWQTRMCFLQGAIIMASLVQMLLSITGVVGILLRFVTPLTTAPTITIIGLALYGVARDKAAEHWGIAILTVLTITVCSQYMRNINVPIPRYKEPTLWFPLFSLFPIVIGVFLPLLLCIVLTLSGAVGEDSSLRTDKNIRAVHDASWLRVPYPLQWGAPTVSVTAAISMLPAVAASIIESIGDYYACAEISGEIPPPQHAVNRGIFIEGIGGVLSGLFGTGNALTSYSQNIGAIGITKVASRRVVQWGGLIIMLFAVVGKFGALLLLIPSPIIGGMFIVAFAMTTSVGLSSLQHVDLNSTRNLFVLGMPLMLAFVVPTYIEQNEDAIQTGSVLCDQIIKVLLSTSMFVAGVVACLLDNTIPGTDAERGILIWKPPHSDELKKSSTYKLPWISSTLDQWKWARHIPISPTYEQPSLPQCRPLSKCYKSSQR